ncbi:MAG: hypothetical protein EU539_04675 [Promethearchaeota archaeon]|nr:MAG: hypothetical protein EU539_04675 [Candidatus Lokiarchaeota archaeon]
MRYVFKILILGDPETSIEYLVSAFQDGGELKDTYYEWYQEVNALEDTCDLEINLISDIINADFDEIIPTVDGIIYFLNPLDKEESELFEMLYSIINSVKRDIPIIIMYYDSAGVLPISTNLLLENLWVNFSELEAFVNLPPYLFHQALQCLCLAMISGESPLNIENAWMRFPIFIQLANIHFNQQDYIHAAQAMKKAATISEIYNSDEFFIHCEQAAYLFSKVNLYLEASKILESVDKQRYKDFRRQYHEAMIVEGNKLFNNGDYESAAKQYDTAGRWASIELENPELIEKSFKLAINSWISACKVDKAFVIVDRLPHDKKLSTLEEIAEKILSSVDYLLSIGDLEGAKDQLYYSIFTYQREALFDLLKKFTNKQVEVLIKILEYNIDQSEPYAAKDAYDEIENLWESYKVKKTNLDKQIEKLIKQFIEQLNSGMATILINKLDSFKKKEKLTELLSKTEEKEKLARKKEIEENILKGLDVIETFVQAELNIIIEMNKNVINEAEKYSKNNEDLKAAKLIKNQSVFLYNIGREEIGDRILMKSLDLLLDAEKFDMFFNYYSDLSEEMKKEYLIQVFPHYIEILKELMEKESLERNQKIFEVSLRNYRNFHLYDEAKEISRFYIKMIKKQALKTLEAEEDVNGIDKANALIKKVNDIFLSYLDKEKDKINLDKINYKIAEIYLSMEDFSSTLSHIDKIENKKFKEDLNKKLAKLEEETIKIKSKEKEETRKGEELKEILSIIKKKARDAHFDRDNDFKKRKARKRAYLNDALKSLKNEAYEEAVEAYEESIIRFSRIKEYYLAGVSFAIASLLLIRQEKYNMIKTLLNEIKTKLSSSANLFLDTFPVKLIDYISDTKRYEEEQKFKEVLSLLENLPLFEEEIIVLFEILGKEYEEKKKEEKDKIDIAEIAKIRGEINKIVQTIEKDKQEFATRKIMKRDYWNKAIEEVSRKNYLGASKIYFESFEILIDKKLYNQAIIGLILGSILLIKESDYITSRKTFNAHINGLGGFKEEIESLPEVKLLKYLFVAYENNFEDLVKSIMLNFARKLMLFDQEQEFLVDFSGEELVKEEKKLQLTRKEKGELSRLQIEYDQKIGLLQQKMGDIRSSKNEFFNKRQAMKKRYYKDVLNLLSEESFEEASEKYSNLANLYMKRKDYELSALNLLLYVLSALKSEKSFKVIKKNVDEYFESLGLSKDLVKGTYYIILLLFILDIKMEGLEQYVSKINPFFNVLPVFEEEKILLRIK